MSVATVGNFKTVACAACTKQFARRLTVTFLPSKQKAVWHDAILSNSDPKNCPPKRKVPKRSERSDGMTNSESIILKKTLESVNVGSPQSTQKQ
eukprot:5398286-Amphidinium_carterae.1